MEDNVFFRDLKDQSSEIELNSASEASSWNSEEERDFTWVNLLEIVNEFWWVMSFRHGKRSGLSWRTYCWHVKEGLNLSIFMIFYQFYYFMIPWRSGRREMFWMHGWLWASLSQTVPCRWSRRAICPPCENALEQNVPNGSIDRPFLPQAFFRS